MIRFDNISLKFPEQIICENLSFKVKEGEMVGLSAPSGKGKTSLLKLMMGILVPDAGKILVNNIEVNPSSIDEIRKQIIWLPQNVNLPIESGQELVELLELDEEGIKNYHSFLKFLGIDNNGKLFNKMSGGQRQRMIVAACLSMNKPILVLDEPVSALDDDSIDLFIELIQSLKNKTIISTSHNQKWLNHCSQIIEL
ncbi:ATP-binding cassette domain-containing protein [Marinifilum sp. N1E240]|uniref:ATP-binding cassette domain-containing protein n=1 Tax=Marinifilum sp. N1E240 TaxID=2608082 RepID=UPI00128CFF0A|nr:ATP-binding cassette domain-containing protein [Marinifilum sp. N1E240]MPQ46668.1 ATP-binding cassette domain-containing protein [Marinifilum sp. N1E240]